MGAIKWTLGSSPGRNRMELRSVWKRHLGRKGVDYSPSYLITNPPENPDPEALSSHTLLAYHPAQNHHI